jgi:hypothetical protein
MASVHLQQHQLICNSIADAVDALPMLWMRCRCCGCVADAVDALAMLWMRC